MPKIITFILVVALVVFATPRDTLTVQENGNSTSAGAWYSKKVKRNAPVVIWFHGGMVSSRCAKGLEAGAMYFELDSNSVVMSPSACQNNHWLNGDVLRNVDLELDLLETKLKRKITQVNLVGVSDGGLGVAAYSIVGRREVKQRLLVSSFLLNMDPDGNLKFNDLVARGSWIFVQGGSDRLYPAELSMPWIENFCAGKAKCSVHFDPKGEHDWSYWKSNHLDWISEFTSQLTTHP